MSKGVWLPPRPCPVLSSTRSLYRPRRKRCPVREAVGYFESGSLAFTKTGGWSEGPLRYYFSLALPASNFLALYSDVVCSCLPSALQGMSAVLQGILSFSGFLFPFILLPILDVLIGRDTIHPPREIIEDGWYRLPVYLYVPIHLSLLYCCCQRASILSPLHFWGVAMGVGICGGLAFTVAHELIHGNKKWESAMVDVLLCVLCYMHYAQSHIAHHIKVGTRDDAGTARKHESYYAFLPRAVYMSVRDGIWMEKRRMKSLKLPPMHPQNRMFVWFLSPLMVFAAVFCSFGRMALVFMIVQATVAIATLENVNYLEHYGLVRHSVDGKLESVAAKHSWNADWTCTSSLVFQLQRHAHHHLQSSMPYQGLKSLSEAPLLPMSYPGVMMAALLPPLYYRLMHPLIEEYERRYSVDRSSTEVITEKARM